MNQSKSKSLDLHQDNLLFEETEVIPGFLELVLWVVVLEVKLHQNG